MEQCLSNALRLEIYIQDAEREGDSELADFFRRAQAESRKGADQGKQLLKSRRLGRGQREGLRREVAPWRIIARDRARSERDVRRIAGSWPESGSQ